MRDWIIQSLAISVAVFGLSQIANAATERVVYVNTDAVTNGDGSSGSPYQSINYALDLETKTLVASDRQLTIKCRGQAADTLATVNGHSFESNLNGFVGNTDVTRYLRIGGDSSSDYGEHDGIYSTSKYRWAKGGDPMIDLLSGASTSRLDWRLEGFIIYQTSTSASNRSALNIDYHPGEFHFTRMILRGDRSGSPGGASYGLRLLSVSSTTKITNVYLYNSVIYDFYGSGVIWKLGTGAGLYALNNTIYNTGNGTCGSSDCTGAFYLLCQDGASGTLTVKNNAMQACGGACYSKGYSNCTYSTANNLSSDASAPEVSYQSKTVAFVSAGSDMHLASGDTEAKNNGADLSGTFTVDLDGQTRSGSWDIGADEYIAPLPATISSMGSFYKGMQR